MGCGLQAIKKILEENFHCNEEISSQALLFKSLWLETEANLCSIGYQARFDQMKIEMGEIEANTLKGYIYILIESLITFWFLSILAFHVLRK